MWETWVGSLSWEDPQEEGTATHSSILAWRIPWTEEPGRLICGVSKSQTQLSDFHFHLDFPGGSAGKESTCKEGDLASIPGLGRSPGGGNSYPLQYSGLENSMDYVYGVTTKPLTLSFSAYLRFKTKLQCSKRYNWVIKLKKSKTKIP